MHAPKAARRFLSGGHALAAALTVFAATTAQAQPWPSKPVTIVVPFPPGAATDVFARSAGRRMGELLNQTFIVLNRDGASGSIGTELVARASADGHTLLWGSSGPLAISPVWTEKLPYEPLRDFAPVSLFAKIPFLLIVHPSVPARNLTELIALARANPGKLNYASSGTGGTAHLAAELFRSLARIDIVHVPYRGTALFATDLVAGQVDLAFAGPTTGLPHVTTGRLRAIATSGMTRTPLLPQLPTMAEAGLPGYEFTQWYGLLAPARTSRDIVATLNSALHKAMDDAEVKKRVATEGGSLAPTTPDNFGHFIRDELAKNARMIRASGLKRE
jgi:tripartite-type tricarboxylate transporter receptor subunit TctC